MSGILRYLKLKKTGVFDLFALHDTLLTSKFQKTSWAIIVNFRNYFRMEEDLCRDLNKLLNQKRLLMLKE
jgi:hypothetical protein